MEPLLLRKEANTFDLQLIELLSHWEVPELICKANVEQKDDSKKAKNSSDESFSVQKDRKQRKKPYKEKRKGTEKLKKEDHLDNFENDLSKENNCYEDVMVRNKLGRRLVSKHSTNNEMKRNKKLRCTSPKQKTVEETGLNTRREMQNCLITDKAENPYLENDGQNSILDSFVLNDTKKNEKEMYDPFDLSEENSENDSENIETEVKKIINYLQSDCLETDRKDILKLDEKIPERRDTVPQNIQEPAAKESQPFANGSNCTVSGEETMAPKLETIEKAQKHDTGGENQGSTDTNFGESLTVPRNIQKTTAKESQPFANVSNYTVSGEETMASKLKTIKDDIDGENQGNTDTNLREFGKPLSVPKNVQETAAKESQPLAKSSNSTVSGEETIIPKLETKKAQKHDTGGENQGSIDTNVGEFLEPLTMPKNVQETAAKESQPLAKSSNSTVSGEETIMPKLETIKEAQKHDIGGENQGSTETNFIELTGLGDKLNEARPCRVENISVQPIPTRSYEVSKEEPASVCKNTEKDDFGGKELIKTDKKESIVNHDCIRMFVCKEGSLNSVWEEQDLLKLQIALLPFIHNQTFLGVQLEDGMICFNCVDVESKTWLVSTLKKFNLWKGSKLFLIEEGRYDIMKQLEIKNEEGDSEKKIRKTRSKMWFKVGKILDLLYWENPEFNGSNLENGDNRLVVLKLTTPKLKELDFNELMKILNTTEDFQSKILEKKFDNGMMLFNCADRETKDMLALAIKRLNPWKGAQLVVVESNPEKFVGEWKQKRDMAKKAKNWVKAFEAMNAQDLEKLKIEGIKAAALPKEENMTAVFRLDELNEQDLSELQMTLRSLVENYNSNILDVRLHDGVVVFNCSDRKFRDSLSSEIKKLNPWKGSELFVVNQTKNGVIKKNPSVAKTSEKVERFSVRFQFPPLFTEDKCQDILKLLGQQNDDLKISDWKIVAVVPGIQGKFLEVSLTEGEFKKLEEKQMAAFLGFEKIQFSISENQVETKESLK